MNTREWMEGCTCHLGHPPCSFCMTLTEDEADIYARSGMTALIRFRDEQEAAPEMTEAEKRACELLDRGAFW